MYNVDNRSISRTMIYLSMVVMFAAIFLGALRGADPIFLAVGFIGEIILGATAHLSGVIERCQLGPVERSSE